MLLILAALGVTVFAGCGGGGAAQSSGQEGQQASQSAGPSDQKTVAASGEARATEVRLGHPSFGSAEAPVVMTEYGDYQ
jgi:protein-disulfide isomerase